MEQIPCIDCITLAICNSKYQEYDCQIVKPFKSLPIIPLMRKCTLIRYYMYRVNRESDDRKLVPRNNGINIDNVHQFFRGL